MYTGVYVRVWMLRAPAWPWNSGIRLDEKVTNDIKMGWTSTGTWPTPQNPKQPLTEIQTQQGYMYPSKRVSLLVSPSPPPHPPIYIFRKVWSPPTGNEGHLTTFPNFSLPKVQNLKIFSFSGLASLTLVCMPIWTKHETTTKQIQQE